MDTLVQGYKYPGSSNVFKVNHNYNSISAFSGRNHGDGLKRGVPMSDHHELGVLPNVPNPSNSAQFSGISSKSDSLEESILKYISKMLMEEEDKPCEFQDQKVTNGFKVGNHVSGLHEFGAPANGPTPSKYVQSLFMCSDLDSPEDAMLKYISQMLMEEDLEHKPCMYQDCLALQAAEKSFYDVLGQKYPPSLDNSQTLFVHNQNAEMPDANFTRTHSSPSSDSSTAVDNFLESDWLCDGNKLESSCTQKPHVEHDFGSVLQSFGSSNRFSEAVDGPVDSPVAPFEVPNLCNENQLVSEFSRRGPKLKQFLEHKDHRKHDPEPNERNLKVVVKYDNSGRDHSLNGSGGKKYHYRDDSQFVEGSQSNKQLAVYAHEETDDQSELYDEVLLVPGCHPCLQQESALCSNDDTSYNGATKQIGQSKGSIIGRPRGKKQGNKKEVVDLMNLLTQCAQAMTIGDSRTANELLKRIRQHSSPDGEGTERLSHFFANALEARLAGAGAAPYTAYVPAISAADLLKAYQVYIKACPFKLLSNLFSNQSILKLSGQATSLHIIDFGIKYGFQWPCLIQRLSARPGGPPKLRITGVELPQPGFCPAERVEETGRRLAKYCDRFSVPFEFNAIAKNWETIQPDELKIEKDELLVVNCLYRMKDVPDDTIVESSPRDIVLNLIKRINPDLFIHGVLNGTFNAPFFVSRFREALFHFSALFNMFETTALDGDQERRTFEKVVFGRDIMNVIACEGTQRFERPETYKQWQARNLRAGFRQLPLDLEIVGDIRFMVRRGYNQDFVVDEDSNWMLQGWKGRILYAISCWKPV